MKGYVYLDNDRNLNIRNKEFIENEDPGFWGRNSHYIDVVWSFDSDNEQGMYDLLASLRKYELQSDVVLNFCKSIGFDLPAFLIKHAKNR